MPSLTPEDQEQLLGETSIHCVDCGYVLIRNYCRSCDEFFFECRCPMDGRDDHTGHRTY